MTTFAPFDPSILDRDMSPRLRVATVILGGMLANPRVAVWAPDESGVAEESLVHTAFSIADCLLRLQHTYETDDV